MIIDDRGIPGVMLTIMTLLIMVIFKIRNSLLTSSVTDEVQSPKPEAAEEVEK